MLEDGVYVDDYVIYYRKEKIMEIFEFGVFGMYNVENVLVVIIVVKLYGILNEVIW